MATNYTLEELADLEAALAAAVLRVTHNGVITIFQSRDDMLKQVRLMRSELGLPIDAVERVTPRIRRVRPIFSKGL